MSEQVKLLKEGLAAEKPPERVGLGLSSRTLKIGLALFALYIIWGSTYFAIRIALRRFPPFSLGGLRYLIAGSILYFFTRARGGVPPTRQQWLGAAAVGLLLIVGGNGAVIIAEQWVPSGLAAICVATMPLWAVLFAGLWGRWPVKLEWLGLALGMSGVVLLNLDTNLSASPLGLVFLLVAPVAWAFGSVWSHHLPLPPKLMNSAAQMLAGGLAFMLLALVFGERMNAWPGPDALLAFGFLIVFGSLIAYTAYNYLLRQVKPALATSYAYVNPVVALGLGVGLGGEPVSLIGVLASLVVLTGVVLVTLSRS